MFSYLRTGDIHTTIRKMTSLPGLSISDTDKIKYALLNHSTAMRANLSGGAPIFNNIRAWEAEIEKRDIASMMSGVLPSMAANAAAAAAATRLSLFTDNDLRIDNAALAFIMAKELAFLNRTIQMITLIANRYNEEQQDLMWGRGDDNDDNDDDGSSSDDNDEEDLECGGGVTLQRSQSHDHPYTPPAAAAATTNQLATTFLIASGRLMQRFNGLCELAGTNVILVNAMTTRDQPHSSADNLETQLSAQSLVISDIFLHFGNFATEHRDPVVLAFLELRDISVSAWKIMSMFAFSNLFRLTAGTEYAMCYYQPEDAIFAQGRDYLAVPEPCCGGLIITDTTATTEQGATEAASDATEESDATESHW